jgi:hypothetical protein
MIADGNVELSVRTERHPSPVVSGGIVAPGNEQQLLRRYAHPVVVAITFQDAGPVRVADVVHIHKGRIGIGGMNGNAEEALPPLVIHRNRHEGFGTKSPVVKTDPSRHPLAEEECAISPGDECDRRRKLYLRGAGKRINAKRLRVRRHRDKDDHQTCAT